MKRETYIYKDYTALDTNFYLYLLETEEKKEIETMLNELKEEKE